MKKQCSKCKEFKDLSMFSKSKGAKDNLYPCCKSCSSIINKSYRINNIDKIKEIYSDPELYDAAHWWKTNDM